jgi:hypothetical protein
MCPLATTGAAVVKSVPTMIRAAEETLPTRRQFIADPLLVLPLAMSDPVSAPR